MGDKAISKQFNAVCRVRDILTARKKRGECDDITFYVKEVSND
tara:strand:- start:449 stop:577 length:129 start_codon:yes stop_codon:yes gene_type:complete